MTTIEDHWGEESLHLLYYVCVCDDVVVVYLILHWCDNDGGGIDTFVKEHH